MYKYTLHVGLKTNKGKKILNGTKTIESTLNTYFSGYTLQKANGYWNKKKEKTIIITIINESVVDFIIDAIIDELKAKLQQDCIMLEKSVNTNVVFK